MKQGAEFVCVLEFSGTERTIAAVVPLGALARVSLPATITWPDGSQSDYLDVVIEALPDLVSSRPSAPLVAESQHLTNSPGGQLRRALKAELPGDLLEVVGD